MSLNLQNQTLNSVLELVKRGLTGEEGYDSTDIEEQFSGFTDGDLSKNLSDLDEADCLSLLEILWEFVQSPALSAEEGEFVKELVASLEDVAGNDQTPLVELPQVADLLTETADYIEVKNIPSAAQGVSELAELINFGGSEAVASAMAQDPASALPVLQSFFSASGSGVSVANLIRPEELENFIGSLSEAAVKNPILSDILEYVEITL